MKRKITIFSVILIVLITVCYSCNNSNVNDIEVYPEITDIPISITESLEPTIEPTCTIEPTESITIIPTIEPTPTTEPTTTPKPTLAQTVIKEVFTPTKKISKIVYITETGNKYHKAGCKYLDESKIEIDLQDAISRGYIACKVCKP